MYPERFWQAFLAADPSKQMAEEFLNSLRPTDSDPTEIFLSWPKLSDEAKKRIALVKQPKKVDNFSLLLPDQFPQTIKQIQKPPYALFARGNPDCLYQTKIGIVGTRRATTQGQALAQKFAEHLALAGCTVVSGGALGIDIAAHKGALAVKKPTVCVLPCGVDVAQPPRHATYFEEIALNGCLISQFANGTPTSAQALLSRNGLLAALVDVLLVIEAPLPSGSLNTATHAANFNRPIYVIPGSITNENYRGSHQLIRDGATLVDHPDQILEDLAISFEVKSDVNFDLTEIQSQILHLLGSEAIPIETIASQTGLTTQGLLSEITMLELDGLVVKHSGGYARKMK